MPGGAVVMLRQLLAGFPTSAYAFLTDSTALYADVPPNEWLPVPYYFHPNRARFFGSDVFEAAKSQPTSHRSSALRSLFRAARTASDYLEVRNKLPDLTRHAGEVIAREKAELVLAPSSDPIFVVAAANAARAAGIPLYVHLFDLFAGNNYSTPKRKLAARSEALVLKGAHRVFVTNDTMAAYYRRLHGIETTVVPNGTLIPSRSTAREVSTTPTILYTGAVYWAQRDALRRLVSALRQVPEVRLEIRTKAATHALVQAGVTSQSRAGFTDQDSALQAQRSADILFLPLAFQTRAPDVIRTAFPGKTAEYLVSGTPILVHAPHDSYISQYARRAGWGYVVDTSEPEQLTIAVKRLLRDSDLRSRLVSSAYEEAQRALDLSKIQKAYVNYFAA